MDQNKILASVLIELVEEMMEAADIDMGLDGYVGIPFEKFEAVQEKFEKIKALYDTEQSDELQKN